MPVTARTLRLEQALARELAAITDAQVRDLVAAWADAWDEVAPDLQTALLEVLAAGGKVTRAQMLRAQRLQAVLAIIATNLTELATQAGVRLTADVATVVTQAGTAQSAIVDAQLPAGSKLVNLQTWSRVDADTVTAIVERTTEQITSLTTPLGPEAYQAVRRELIRGVAAGSNPRQVAARMVQRAEGRFNGGLARATTIARTEMLDAHRAAAAVGQEQHAEVLAGWVWNTHLDARTCPACIAMAGREFPLEEPGPLGHQNCRCARTPVTRSWADLGFGDLDEPASVLPDAEAWFAGLSEAEQKRILGASRYAAWVAGDFPISAWAQRRSTSGWRDSFHVAPAPQSGGRRSTRAA
jgi:SPP1 gp7 family putative phage head morphogenesis protein